MSIVRFIGSIFSIGLMMLGAGVASSQTTSTGSGQAYPNKTIRIVTAVPGSGTDVTARLIAQGLTAPLGQPVIVENRPSGIIPGEIVSKAAPDGYTLLVAGVIFMIGHLLQETPYDPLRDFESISMVGIQPALLVVHPSLPVKSVKELIALAKARPGVLNYAIGGIGGASHLAMELFSSMAGGLNMVQINYKGGAGAAPALMAGEVEMSFIVAGSVMPFVKSGKLRALAVTSPQPTVLAPGLPTVAASGLPGYEAAARQVIVAPAKTPAAVITRLNQEIVRILNQPDVKQKLLGIGVEALGSSPEELTAATKAEIARMDKVIKAAGIKLN